jgi:acetolactate synthase I/II/III large subunit
MKASDFVADFLDHRGVTQVYELVGGMITHLVDSIHLRGKVRIVSMHHEQGAAFAADATGRITGVPGVAMATSGPGATNLLTGIGSCFFDSSPAVFITGQVNRSELRGERAIRQLGFQETDIVSMATPITKWAVRVDDPEELPAILARGFDLAVAGRPGPVLIDIPMDVQRIDIEPRFPDPAPIYEAFDPEPGFWDALFEKIATAKRPLILAGAGVRAGNAIEPFRAFVDRVGIPVVNSLNAVDALRFDHPMRFGMIGSYGNRWVNLAVGEADLILVVGSRLDIRQTGADTAAWKGERTVIHVDCEPGEINNRVLGCETVLAHLLPFLTQAVERAKERSLPSYGDWLDRLNALRAQWPDTRELDGTPGINPNEFLHRLTRAMPHVGTYCVDVGQHQMWAAQSADVYEDQRFLTSGGMGSMGFALPAAIGAAVSTGRPACVIAGDGGFQCNLQELQTVARNRLPIKMVVLNNGCHGMVRQFQESYFDGRYQSTLWGYDAPDFAKVAQAFGLAGQTVECDGDVDHAVAWLNQDPEAPALLQVMIDPGANAYPKIAFGHPMTEMEPYATPLDMEGT